jgi:hypothetical protein
MTLYVVSAPAVAPPAVDLAPAVPDAPLIG